MNKVDVADHVDILDSEFDSLVSYVLDDEVLFDNLYGPKDLRELTLHLINKCVSVWQEKYNWEYAWEEAKDEEDDEEYEVEE
jgi:hypothetical protein